MNEPKLLMKELKSLMNEPKLKNKKEIISKLKLFWKEYWEKWGKFNNEVAKLEKKMTDKIGMNIELGFHVENEFVGIGASNMEDRNKFPLIKDSDFGDR